LEVNTLKKLFCLSLAAVMMMACATGCGSTKVDETTIDATTLLAANNFDVADYVDLCDYTDIQVAISSAYEVTDDDVKDYVNSALENADVDADYDSFTDEIASTTFGYDTASAYIDVVREYLENSAQSSYTSSLHSAIVENLISRSTITFPDNLVDTNVQLNLSQIESYAADQDYTLEDYISTYYGYSSVDDFTEYLTNYVEDGLTQDLVLQAVIKDMDMSITESGYQEYIQQYLDAYGMTEDEFYEQYGDKESIMLIYAEDVVLGELEQYTTVSDLSLTTTVVDDATDTTEETVAPTATPAAE
jgi:trigger factor